MKESLGEVSSEGGGEISMLLRLLLHLLVLVSFTLLLFSLRLFLLLQVRKIKKAPALERAI